MLCVALVLSSQKRCSSPATSEKGKQGCSEAWDACLVVPKAKALALQLGEGSKAGCDGSPEAAR